jgi:CCR4-NOT transcription complex subunit 9
MMPQTHVYGHHQFNPGADSPWVLQPPGHHQHAQQAAAAAAAAQQQHYNRLAGGAGTGAGAGGSGPNHNGAGALAAAHAQEGSHENISEDNRRTMAFIADLLNESTRETALLELSKKREQVPELALILWHSFGKIQRSQHYPLLCARR